MSAIYALPAESTRHRGLVSPLLIAASVLLPGGFFLGGCFIYESDPGLGIWLVPVGALCLFTEQRAQHEIILQIGH